MKLLHSVRVAESSWPVVQTILESGAHGIIPIGAASKEHGPHLPLNTDYLQAQWFAQRVSISIPFLIWPVVSYGHYPAFVEYPGSSSLSATTFLQMMHEIIEGACRHGLGKLFLLNTGISTIAPLQQAIAGSAFTERLHLINIYAGKHYLRTEKQLQQQAAGGHADEIETSIMLAIAPHCVQMQLAEPGLVNKRPGPLNRTQPAEPNFSPNGIIGNPTVASVQKGKAFVQAICQDIEENIRLHL